MKKNFTIISLIFLLILSLAFLSGCSSPKEEAVANNEKVDGNNENTANNKKGVVNLYTDRHYDTDEQLLKVFTEETGIKVNVVKGKSDELIERLAREGKDTEADLLITADAGRLHRAKVQELLHLYPVKFYLIMSRKT